jgi:fido (protein-threonine AMPylation protein)
MHTFVLDYEEQVRDLKPVYQGIKSTTKSDFIELVEHILEVSAFAHWKLVHIHSFSDGNGRTARILGNMILQWYGLRPISIFVKDKARYHQSLHEADKFNLDPLKRHLHCFIYFPLLIHRWMHGSL